MYANKLHRGRITCHIIDCFKINGKQRIKMPKKGDYLRFKNFERNFEIILVLEVNGKENPDESQTNRYQKPVAGSFDHQLVLIISLVRLLNHTQVKMLSTT